MSRPIQAAIYLAISTFLLSLVLRTWLVMGIINPVTISGSSMASGLRGPYVVATCMDCKTAIEVGAEFASQTETVSCPNCGQPRVPLTGLKIEQADGLIIDRTFFSRRNPRRWDVAIMRQPDDGRQLCIKRIVGLPGETINLHSGDVWVEGKIVTKPLEKQLAMRQLISKADKPHLYWHTDPEISWSFAENSWHCQSKDNSELQWLRYESRQPITDDVTYNAGLTRRLNRVRDFMLSAQLHATGNGTIAFELNDGTQSYRVFLSPSSGKLTLNEVDTQQLTKIIPKEICQQIMQDSVSLVLSNFDRQLLFALDGHILLQEPLDRDTPLIGTASPVSIGARGVEVSLSKLALYRDIYYPSAPKKLHQSEPETTICLGEDEYYVLGDNSPVSVDSRSWGPISGHLMLGSPLGVR